MKKVKSAVTDSGSEVRRGPDKPGVSNLIDVLAAVRGSTPEAVEEGFEGQRYGDLKAAAAEEIVEHLRPVRERYAELRPDEGALEEALEGGAERARAMAAETMVDVRRAMGIGPAR